MTDMQSRLEQFRKMAEADPSNTLGHFSLGRAYLDAQMYEPAAASFERVLELDANISKAWQLLAEALQKLGRKGEAVQRLTKGLQIAHERGDIMPKNDMLRMLKELGAPVPELTSAAQARPAGQGEVLCQRCNKIGPKLPSPPFSNAQGREIFEKICAPCWKEWIGMGTKVINELRLPLNDPQAQKVFDQHMMEFLNLRPQE